MECEKEYEEIVISESPIESFNKLKRLEQKLLELIERYENIDDLIETDKERER